MERIDAGPTRALTRNIADCRGLAAKGVGVGDKVLIHADNCPEMVLAWYACAKVGAVGVTTNTRSVGAEIQYFASHTKCVGAITQPQYASLVKEHAPDLGWLVVTEDNSGIAPSAEEAGHGLPAFASLYANAADAPQRDPEPMLPVASCSPPEQLLDRRLWSILTPMPSGPADRVLSISR